MYDLVIRNGRLVTADGIYEAQLAVRNGSYVGIFAPGEKIEAAKTIEAGGNYVFPGIIDCHVHLNEPGFEYREDITTGTRAAAAAGCTCLLDMPLNNDPPMVNCQALELKKQLISQKACVDIGLWGGITGESTVQDLLKLQQGGVAAFKGFTCPNGALFSAVNLGNARRALEVLKPYGALLGFHCEEYGQVLEREQEARKKKNQSEAKKRKDFLMVHDPWTEYTAVQEILALARATGGRVHICHVSHPLAAQAIKEAIQAGLFVTAETCPHYLGFTEELLLHQGAPAKCTPPLRKKEDVTKLWDYVLDGTLSCIGSDHSPAADDEKENHKHDIWTAWGGLNTISGFFPMMFDMVVHQRHLSPCLIARVMSENPAKIFGLFGKKGAFAVGFDADAVIVDANRKWKYGEHGLLTKGQVSCFQGLEGKGAPVTVILRGRVIAEHGACKEDIKGYGTLIKPVRREES